MLILGDRVRGNYLYTNYDVWRCGVITDMAKHGYVIQRINKELQYVVIRGTDLISRKVKPC